MATSSDIGDRNAQVQAQLHQSMVEFWHAYRGQLIELDTWTTVVLDTLETYCLRSGKAWRPLLVGVGAAAGQDISLAEAFTQPTVQRLCVLIELLHKRLLIADDVADRDDQRHGEPSFHIVVEQRLASDPRYAALTPEERTHQARTYTEIAGIWLQSIVTWGITSDETFSPAQQVVLNQILQRQVYEYTCNGWLALFDQNRDPLECTDKSQQRLLTGLEQVTGHYSIVAPLQLGLSLGDPTQREAYSKLANRLGHSAGIMFQVADDVLGLYGDPAVTGKPVGGDLREGKKTLFMQWAYASVSRDDQTRLAQVLGSPTCTNEDVVWVQELVKSTGVYDRVQQKIDAYANEAEQVLQAWTHTESREALQALLQKLGKRNK